MGFIDYVKNTAVFSHLLRFIQTEAEDTQPVSDISVSYHDMGQIGRRTEKLRNEGRKVEQYIKDLKDVIAERNGMLDVGKGNRIQLEREIDSAMQKIQELEKQREQMEAACEYCRMYGILGLDYSVSEGSLYYKGKLVRVFSEADKSGNGENEPAAIYENPKGEVSVMAKRGSTGNVLYLKIYD